MFFLKHKSDSSPKTLMTRDFIFGQFGNYQMRNDLTEDVINHQTRPDLTWPVVLQSRKPQTIPHRRQPNDLRVCRGRREEICDRLQQLHRHNMQYPVQGRKCFKYLHFIENIWQAVTGLSSISLARSAKKTIPAGARAYSGSHCEWIDMNSVQSEGVGCANGYKFVIKPQSGPERLRVQLSDCMF